MEIVESHDMIGVGDIVERRYILSGGWSKPCRVERIERGVYYLSDGEPPMTRCDIRRTTQEMR